MLLVKCTARAGTLSDKLANGLVQLLVVKCTARAGTLSDKLPNGLVHLLLLTVLFC